MDKKKNFIIKKQKNFSKKFRTDEEKDNYIYKRLNLTKKTKPIKLNSNLIFDFF